MAITKTLFAIYLQGTAAGYFNFTQTTVKLGLYTSAWTPDYKTTIFASDIAQFECADEGFSGGYNANGMTVQLLGFAADPTNPPVTLNAQTVLWDTLTATFRYAVLYESTYGFLIGAVDYGTDQVYQAAPFSIDLTSGVLTFAVG